jgi:hypothetical protein
MVCGFLAIAAFVGPLRRRGVQTDRILAIGQATSLAAMAVLWLGTGAMAPAMFVLGLAFAVGNVAYAELTARFAPALAGRVNAALNLAVFVGAFAAQWGYGVVLDALQRAGWTPADSHAAAFGGLIALQAAGFAWFLASRGERRSAEGTMPAEERRPAG